MNQNTDFETFYHQQLEPIVSKLNSKKKLRFWIKIGIPIFTVILIIIQYIINDSLPATFNTIGIIVAGALVYFIVNKTLLDTMLKNIERAFLNPIIETYYPQLSMPENKTPFGLNQSGLFAKNAFDYKREADFRLLLESNEPDKSYQCSVLKVRIGVPNTAGDAYNWKHVFGGCFVVHKLNTEDIPELVIRPKNIKRAYLSRKRFRTWVERTTGIELFDEHYKLMTPTGDTDISIVKEKIASRILRLKEAFNSKVYLSTSDQFVFAAITLVATVEIGSFSKLNLKLAKEAHAYFEKTILMIKAMDLD